MNRLLMGFCAALSALACGACDASQTTRSGAPSQAGAAVFAHSCASCHSLVGNESRRKQGGDLLGYDLTRAQLTSFTRVMPARLNAAQLRAVVDYVYRVQQSRGKGLLGLPAG